MEKEMASHSSTLAWKIPWTEEPGRLQSMGLQSRTRLSDFTFTFHFHALEKEMATHSSVLAWRIPGMGEPGGLPSMGSHRVRHDWSDLAAAAAVFFMVYLSHLYVTTGKMIWLYGPLLAKWYLCFLICCLAYMGILPSHKKEWNFAICNNMDGSGGYYA